MYYQILENLLKNHELDLASDKDVELIDGYLASLTSGQAGQISPWRLSQKLNLGLDAIYEIFLKASKYGLLSVKYEVWHPETRVKILDTFDKERLKEPIENEESGPIIASDDDVKLSFRLNDVRNNVEKKNQFTYSRFKFSVFSFKQFSSARPQFI